VGLVDDARWGRFQSMLASRAAAAMEMIQQETDRGPGRDRLAQAGRQRLKKLAQLSPVAGAIPPDIGFRIEVAVKYEGYIVGKGGRSTRCRGWKPSGFRMGWTMPRFQPARRGAAEAVQFTPRSLGQALRISGITPADVTVLAVHLGRST